MDVATKCLATPTSLKLLTAPRSWPAYEGYAKIRRGQAGVTAMLVITLWQRVEMMVAKRNSPDGAVVC